MWDDAGLQTWFPEWRLPWERELREHGCYLPSQHAAGLAGQSTDEVIFPFLLTFAQTPRTHVLDAGAGPPHLHSLQFSFPQ